MESMTCDVREGRLLQNRICSARLSWAARTSPTCAVVEYQPECGVVTSRNLPGVEDNPGAGACEPAAATSHAGAKSTPSSARSRRAKTPADRWRSIPGHPASYRVRQSSGPTTLTRPTCDGCIYCSPMTSCAEATCFLRHCPGTKPDRRRGRTLARFCGRTPRSRSLDKALGSRSSWSSRAGERACRYFGCPRCRSSLRFS